MNNRLYIKDVKTKKLIEVLQDHSEKLNILSECAINYSGIQSGTIIKIEKEKLRKKIVDLIFLRDKSPNVDFGNRFEYEQCYKKIHFEGVEYELETSGSDNLIIFAMNLFNYSASRFLISNQ